MFKKEIKRGGCPKTQENTHKKGKIKKERRTNMQKTYKFVKMSNNKVKKLLIMQKCQIRVSKRSHRQRQQEEKKETTDEQIDEQRDIKR